MLEAKGLTTVEDLLAYTPLRYEDRSNLKPIGQLAPGEMATVIAEVRSGKVVSLIPRGDVAERANMRVSSVTISAMHKRTGVLIEITTWRSDGFLAPFHCISMNIEESQVVRLERCPYPGSPPGAAMGAFGVEGGSDQRRPDRRVDLGAASL